MTVGSVKFYKRNKINENTTVLFTSASSGNKDRLYDNDFTSKLVSVGSDDLTPEVWDFSFSSAVNVDAIFVGSHNIKSGGIQYWNGSAFTAFSTPITYSANTDVNSFHSFTQVSTTKIRVTMNTTQTADAEKQVGELRFLELIGTVQKNPVQIKQNFNDNSRTITTSSGGTVFVRFGSKYQAKYTFEACSDTDLALFLTLKDLKDVFFVYPCGGTAQTEYGFRVQDMFLVNYVNDYNPDLVGDLFDVGMNLTLDLREV